MAQIKCTKDLYNEGVCFSKGETYETTKQLFNKASLIDATAINNMGERHIIGMWWRHFKILN